MLHVSVTAGFEFASHFKLATTDFAPLRVCLHVTSRVFEPEPHGFEQDVQSKLAEHVPLAQNQAVGQTSLLQGKGLEGFVFATALPRLSQVWVLAYSRLVPS